MAVYRGLEIAADKPATAEQGGIAHHMFGFADASEDVTAVRYRDLARGVIAEIHARGAAAILVGGSGLWFRAVVDDLDFAPTSRSVRSRLENVSTAELLQALRDADPERAAAIDPRNRRRVVRAVEILELTGRPPSELRRSWDRRCGPYELVCVGMTWDRPELFERAAARVRRQIDAGLVDEVRRLRQAGLSQTAGQALGVKEMADYIDGVSTLDEAEQRLVRNTKRFIRRQLSWFGADPRVEWVNLSRTGWDGGRDRILELAATV
jgi:tRNA dimethylallyltransferase